jgi:hypothetical protein
MIDGVMPIGRGFMGFAASNEKLFTFGGMTLDGEGHISTICECCAVFGCEL